MKRLAIIACAICLASFARAADPAPLTEVRIKETAERQYLCAKKELKIGEMHEFAITTIKQLMEKATELKLMQGGPVLFVYYNFHGDPDQKFTVEIGVPIFSEGGANTGAFYVRKVPKFKCAAAVFQGSLAQIGEAWQKFVPAAMSKGEPTEESRELYLYWEGHDSPNNIIELEMGLK
jgi:predicted transcriptional regulator YdeE